MLSQGCLRFRPKLQLKYVLIVRFWLFNRAISNLSWVSSRLFFSNWGTICGAISDTWASIKRRLAISDKLALKTKTHSYSLSLTYRMNSGMALKGLPPIILKKSIATLFQKFITKLSVYITKICNFLYVWKCSSDLLDVCFHYISWVSVNPGLVADQVLTHTIPKLTNGILSILYHPYNTKPYHP